MVSLDKNILDKNSAAAKRMIFYGAQSDLFIIVPHNQKQIIELSEKVKVYATGGNKLQQFCRLKKIGREILKENKIDLITTQDPFFTGLIGVCLKKKTGAKLEVQLHGDFFSSDYYKKSGFKNWLQYYIAKLLVIKKADKLRVVGERIKKSLLSLGIEENKIKVLPIEQTVTRTGAFKIVDLKKDYPEFKKYFIFLGRLEPVKNVNWLIQIFSEVLKKHPDYVLFIMGDGSQRKQLEKEVKNLGVENNIIFTGWVENPIESLKTMDALLLPSLSEGYGLVAIEASTLNVLIIMSDVGLANFELKPGDKVKILPLDKQKWVEEILRV